MRKTHPYVEYVCTNVILVIMIILVNLVLVPISEFLTLNVTVKWGIMMILCLFVKNVTIHVILVSSLPNVRPVL
jgi:hypothetical protein